MRKGFLVVVVGFVLVACSGSDPGDTTTSGPPAAASTAAPPTASIPAATTAPAPVIDWAPCGDAECGTLTVPLDHDDLSKGTLDLAVARRLADNPDRRIGVLLYNRGPFDANGSLIFEYDDYFLSPDLRRHFDIVTWEPRAGGSGTTVDCALPDDLFDGWEATPENDDERGGNEAILRRFAQACHDAGHDLLPYLSTAASSADVELIRLALGEDQISYLGAGWGAATGAVYATQHPERIRAMVLDSVPDLNGSAFEFALARTQTREAILTEILDRCAANPNCPLNRDGDPYRMYDELIAGIDETPIVEGETTITQQEVFDYVETVSLSDSQWLVVVQGLANLANGNGRNIVEMMQGLATDGFLVAARICLDWPRADFVRTDQQIEQLLEAAPRIAPNELTNRLCEYWIPDADPPPQITGIGAGPILVVNHSTDSWTPLAGAAAVADDLEEGILLIFERADHGAYFPETTVFGCVFQTVDAYLVDLEIPGDESVCRPFDRTLYPSWSDG